MKLTEMPSLTFARADPEELDAEVCATVAEVLGRTPARADPLRLFLRGVETVILQTRLLIDECAKQNLLAYATGDNLEHLGALVGVERVQPVAAVCTMRLTLSTSRAVATIIPAGIRFTAGDQIFFALDDDVIFLAGETVKECSATCLTVGTVGNGYSTGEIATIVDPQPFLQSAINITESDGGSDIETDDALRERIHEAPEKFSTAGPTGAYKWHVFNTSPLISDVAIVSPSPGKVDVYPLLVGGEMPSEEIINAVDAVLNDRSIRPLTDWVTVKKPVEVEYKIDCEFVINKSEQTSAAAIEQAAEQAVQDYILWQRSKLGRDINPSELIYRLRAAGVKRVYLRHPEFRALTDIELAIPTEIRAAYMGLEAD